DLGALMQRQIAAVGKQLLPAAFVVVHMRTRIGSRACRDEVSSFAKPNPATPHEIQISRLIQKLVYVGALVCDYCHAQLFILERNASVAVQDWFRDSTTVVAIVVVSLVLHSVPPGTQDYHG